MMIYHAQSSDDTSIDTRTTYEYHASVTLSDCLVYFIITRYVELILVSNFKQSTFTLKTQRFNVPPGQLVDRWNGGTPRN